MPLVVVTWLAQLDSTPCALCWERWDSEGPLRCYEKDRYDLRLGADLPYFETAKDSVSWMAAHLGEPCQLELTAARSLFEGVFAVDVPAYGVSKYTENP